MANNLTSMNGGHGGAQQDLSIIGVIGTLGTTDTGGTAAPLPFAVDPTTGAMYVNTQTSNLNGTVLTTAVAVGTATQVLPGTALANRKSVIMYNAGTTNIYLGGSGVGTANGLFVQVNTYSPAFDLGSALIYGVGGTTGGTINVLEAS